jgi:hypothetical protein
MLSGTTRAAAVGNVNMGNVAMDQMQLAPNRTSAFMSSWQNDLSGNTFSSNALTGRTAVSLLRNQGYASRVVSMRVSEQDVQDASRQVDAARGEAVAASTERSAVLSEAFSRGLSKLRSTRNTTGSTSSSFEQLGQTLNRLDQITKSVADSTGLSQSQVAQHRIRSRSPHRPKHRCRWRTSQRVGRQELPLRTFGTGAESPGKHDQRTDQRVQAVRRSSVPRHELRECRCVRLP